MSWRLFAMLAKEEKMPFDSTPDRNKGLYAFIRKKSRVEEPRHLQILRRAYWILRSPRRWTRNTEARTRRGRIVDPRDYWAAQFCANGAVHRAADDLGYSETDLQHALQALGTDIATVNDKDGYKAVRARFEMVIARG